VFDRLIETPLVTGKTITYRCVKQGIAGDQNIASVKTDGVAGMPRSPVNNNRFTINNDFLIIG